MSDTTIQGVDPFLLAVPVSKPGREPKHKYLPGVLIDTEGGVCGTGIGPTRSLPFDPFAEPVASLVREELVGQDATEVRRLWQRLAESKLSQVGADGLTIAARAAVDLALWDICAQRANLPLHALLGTHKKDGDLWTYVTAGDPEWEPERIVEVARSLQGEGWNAIKVKVGRPDPTADARMVQEVRDALEADARLMVDATQRWDLPQAAAFCAEAEDVDLTWIEEPLPAADVASHRRLAEQTRIPIALGESLFSPAQFREFLVAGAVDVVQADATRLAGITEWLAVAGLAEAFGKTLVPHHSDFGQAHQHCAFATRGAIALEFPWDAQVFVDPVEKEGDGIRRPNGIGAGTAIRPAALGEWRR